MSKKIIIIIISVALITCYGYLIYSEYQYLNNGNKIIATLNTKLDAYKVTATNDTLNTNDIKVIESAYDISKSNLEKLIAIPLATDDVIITKTMELETTIATNNEKIAELTVTSEALKAEEAAVIKEYTAVKTAYDIAQLSHLITGVPKINQYPDYPTGCESIALLILLKYYNVSVTADQIVSTLAKGPLPYLEDGVLYGGNPALEFVGDPKSISGYGAYSIPLQSVGNTYKSGIINASGTSLTNLLKIVKQNRPVLVWTSSNLSTPFISATWIHKPTDTTINWYSGEHAVVIIGYNKDQIIISDPIGGMVKYQTRTTFESRYNYFNKQALYY